MTDIFTPKNPQERRDIVIAEASPFTLELDDDLIIEVVRKRQAQYDDYINEYDVVERRRRNKDYLAGKQIDFNQLKPYQTRYIDNLLYEAESSIKPIAMSRMPDLLAKPGQDNPDSKDTAKNITDIINNDIKKRDNRKKYGVCHKQLPLFFTACMKGFWNPVKEDYDFTVIHPDNIIFDPFCPSNDVDDMEFFGHWQEMTVKKVVMQFPNKANDLYEALGFEDGDENKESKMATRIKVLELWFDWPKETRDEETGESKYEMISGVIWKYKNVVLAKMKNPYWDWEGKKKLFTLEMGKKRELTEDEIRSKLFGESDLQTQEQTIYHNYLPRPSKPFYLWGYDQLGEHPLDYTSRIEQVLLQQDNVNKRGRQITEMNERAKGKGVFNSHGLPKENAEDLDMDDMTQDVIVDGNVNEMFSMINYPPAPPQVFKEQEQERNKVFQKMGVNDTTRGVRTADETMGGRQLLREADYGKIDDLVEDTINACAEWQAQWILQFIKLFYTKDHLKRLLGADGETTFVRINQDSIDDGLEVTVSASGVDKMQKKREAVEMVKMKLIDPLTFYMDMGLSDPVGRTEKLLTFMSAPELYLQKFVQKQDTQGMVNQLQGMNAQEMSPQAPPMPPQGPPPAPEGQPPMAQPVQPQ